MKIVAGPYTEYRPGQTIEIVSKRGKKYTWHVTEGMEALGTWLDSRGCSERVCGTGSPRATPYFMRRRPSSVTRRSLYANASLHFTQPVYLQCFMVQENGRLHKVCSNRCVLWELGKLRRVLCLRRRPNEGWVDYMKRTGLIAAKQLKKYKQLRIQELAMKRVKIAAWQMASCPNDAKGRRYWEEIVTWRCDKNWKEDYVKLSKEDYSKQFAVEKASNWTVHLLGITVCALPRR